MGFCSHRKYLHGLVFGLCFALALLLASCGNLYESASCEKSCRDDYNTCLYLAFAQGQTPGGEKSNAIFLYLSCQSAHSVCEDTCGGTSRL